MFISHKFTAFLQQIKKRMGLESVCYKLKFIFKSIIINNIPLFLNKLPTILKTSYIFSP